MASELNGVIWIHDFHMLDMRRSRPLDYFRDVTLLKSINMGCGDCND